MIIDRDVELGNILITQTDHPGIFRVLVDIKPTKATSPDDICCYNFTAFMKLEPLLTGEGYLLKIFTTAEKSPWE
jgi:hypothetical protein